MRVIWAREYIWRLYQFRAMDGGLGFVVVCGYRFMAKSIEGQNEGAWSRNYVKLVLWESQARNLWFAHSRIAWWRRSPSTSGWMLKKLMMRNAATLNVAILLARASSFPACSFSLSYRLCAGARSFAISPPLDTMKPLIIEISWPQSCNIMPYGTSSLCLVHFYLVCFLPDLRALGFLTLAHCPLPLWPSIKC